VTNSAVLSESAVAPEPPPERYLSCRHIERSLVFYPGKVNACCANPVSGQTPTISLFTGGDLSADAVRGGRAKLIERHKRGDIAPECQSCPRLTEEAWTADKVWTKYLIDEVTIAHFTTCNIRCNYCYTVRNERDATALLSKVPRLLVTFEQLIAEQQLAPYATIRFSGGEPTLLPEFEALMTLLANYGTKNIIYTNATRLSPALLDALKRDKVELILGIDAATPEVYRAIKKMDYNEVVWRNVATYCAALPVGAVNKVWAKFIFTRENYKESELFVQRAAASGARSVYYDLDGSKSFFDETTQSYELGRSAEHLPGEIADRIARLRYDCFVRGIETSFAESGGAWLTPERSAYIDNEFARLQQQGIHASLAPVSV
jgi:organic radical activating enzyme